MATDALTGYHDQLMAECRDMIDTRINKVTADAIQTAIVKVLGRPQPAPSVTVAAPHVAVSPAAVNVTVPDTEPEIIVQVDMTPVAKAIAAASTETNALLGKILAVLSAPVTTTVHRDGQFISSTTQTRGT